MFLFSVLLHNSVVFILVVLSQTHAVMVEDQPAGSVPEAITTVTGGSKPLHRFLRGQPKSIGVVLVMMGIGLFMFAIPMNVKSDAPISAEQFTPFWLGILFFICGLLYILSERNPSKKIITASLALSIISVIGVLSSLVEFSRAIIGADQIYWSMRLTHETDTNETDTEEEDIYIEQHYMPIKSMELVFFCHSLIGGILLVTMTIFARAALRSSRTQVVVVMRDLPSAE
ncbi:membrane-spanning 4-domains subfamily A member 4D-like [Carassius carassius]|uniref:membrane-spanning 4-domains subfamily A member 4D-like n=1 Tax=Carassius carassius TaxID=217509 RepID=UPI0028689AA6|nr:membrane-spanning 4-domains subfamily A member 4D-like [Carassius carassius]